MRAQWLLVILVLVCTGCELRLEVRAAFDRDGGGRLDVALAADAELLDAADAAGAAPLDDLAATAETLGGGWKVADTTDDAGTRTVTLSAPFSGSEEFDRLTGELAESLASPEVALLGPLAVHVEEDRLVVDGSAGLRPTEGVAELGLDPEQAVTLLRDEQTFVYVVRVVLPGEVLETNAELRDGRVLGWTVGPGEQVEIRAVGERPASPVWPLVVGGGTGLLFAALVLRRGAVVRRRRAARRERQKSL